MAVRKARVKIPKSVEAGSIIRIKTLLRHRMESGERTDKEGQIIPRDIINHLEVVFNGQLVFSVDIYPAIAANPYIAFDTRVDEAGTYTFKWTDDAGVVTEHSEDIALQS